MSGMPHAAWATGAPGAPTATENAGHRMLAGWITVGGAAVVALGSFLPWASVAFVGSVYGTDGDGLLTLLCALVIGVLALPLALGKGRGWLLGVAAFFGLVATAIAAYDLSNISALASDESLASVGPGLPIIIVGGLIVLCGSVFGLARGRR